VNTLAMNFSICDARAEDAEALIALRRAVFGETDFLLFAPDEYTVSVSEVAAQLDQIAASGHSRVIVASFESEPVGYLQAGGSPIPRRRHAATVAIGVRRSHWGQGIGSALLREALRWAPTAGLSRIELSVIVENTRAIALYEKVGFRVEATRKRAYVINGRPVDDYLMAYVYEA
jgi:RimJ/RimL family protein N-acetyltransferase